MTVLSDEKLLDILSDCTRRDLSELERARAVAEAAVQAEREGAVPVAYLETDCIGERFLLFSKPPVTKHGSCKVEALYAHPPQASATIVAAINSLRSVLCDPEGACCIKGSDADRAIVDAALHTLSEATR